MNTKRRSLQIREDLAFERREWRIQRIGWVVIALLLVLGILGVFGNGPLSRAEVGNGDLQVVYARFAHADAPTTLRISVRQPGAGSVRLAINRDYLDAVPIEHMRPEPERTLSSGADVIFEFAAPGSADLNVSIDAAPQAPGLPVATVRLLREPGATLRFRQLIYP